MPSPAYYAHTSFNKAPSLKVFSFLNESHALLLASLHAQIQLPWENPWSETSYKEILTLPSTKGIGLFEKDHLCAFIIASLCTSDVEILFFMTAPALQKKGYGSQLLDFFLGNHKDHRIFLDVCEENQPAIKLYEKRGFKRFGLRRDYYKNRSLSKAFNALTLALEPIDHSSP